MISVVIPCWIHDEETLKVTQDCVDSFRASGETQLILVDDGSTVGSGYLRSVADIYVRVSHSGGYTRAVNMGMKLARGELIALANNDIRVPSNWIEVSESILSEKIYMTLHPKMMDYNDPFVFGSVVMKTGKERWCQNSFVITTKEFVEKMREWEREDEPYPGLFDENYGVGGGGDDWDFYFRVRKYGYTCYTNKTAFQHLHSFSLKKLGPEREKIAQQNDDYFTQKWGIKKEELFTSYFPDQMQQDWKAGFI